GRRRPRQFPLPAQRPVAPSVVGIKGLAPPVVVPLDVDARKDRFPALIEARRDLGGRPAPVVTGPAFTTLRVSSSRRSLRRFSRSSVATRASNSTTRADGPLSVVTSLPGASAASMAHSA